MQPHCAAIITPQTAGEALAVGRKPGPALVAGTAKQVIRGFD
jgi:hypothetical protein